MSTLKGDTVLENIEGQHINPKALKEIEIAKAKALLEENGIFFPPENKGKQKEEGEKRGAMSVVSQSDVS